MHSCRRGKAGENAGGPSERCGALLAAPLMQRDVLVLTARSLIQEYLQPCRWPLSSQSVQRRLSGDRMIVIVPPPVPRPPPPNHPVPVSTLDSRCCMHALRILRTLCAASRAVTAWRRRGFRQMRCPLLCASRPAHSRPLHECHVLGGCNFSRPVHYGLAVDIRTAGGGRGARWRSIKQPPSTAQGAAVAGARYAAHLLTLTPVDLPASRNANGIVARFANSFFTVACAGSNLRLIDGAALTRSARRSMCYFRSACLIDGTVW